MNFEIGKTYYTRSLCDHNTVYRIAVQSRTAKTITTTDGKTLRVKLVEGTEEVKPLGTYSLCPVIRATKCGLTVNIEAPQEVTPDLFRDIEAAARLFTEPADVYDYLLVRVNSRFGLYRGGSHVAVFNKDNNQRLAIIL